jgi:hypothetical protein
MPELPSSDSPAQDAIGSFIQSLADRQFAASTRRIRRHFLNEYLRYAMEEAQTASMTVGKLMRTGRAQEWLAAAAAGLTRTRNTMNGPQAEASPNSMRARAVTWNAFAEYLGLPDRVDPEAPAAGHRLSPADTERLIHDLSVRRPIHSNAMTALRTAAMASLVADTDRGVPELANLKVSALHLSRDQDAGQPVTETGGTKGHEDAGRREERGPGARSPHAVIDGDTCPLSEATVHVLSRWLSARAVLIAELEGSDPGYLWIPTKPGRARDGKLPPKPGLTPAAVRTLHHAHRTLVSQLLGAPLRPGAIREALAESVPVLPHEEDESTAVRH